MDYDEILQSEEQEQIEQALADEYKEQLDLQLQLDEQKKKPQADIPPEKKKLKRELEREALARLESAARTVSDFENVISWWDRLDANRERKERYHEISRSGDDLPLEFGATKDGKVFPYQLSTVLSKQIQKGDFIDAIFYCPYEIHELVTAEYISNALKGLSEDHKEILFRNVVQGESTKDVGEIRGQTDRNIRKVRATAIRKIHKVISPVLIQRKVDGIPLTIEERQFAEEAIKKALDDSKGS